MLNTSLNIQDLELCAKDLDTSKIEIFIIKGENISKFFSSIEIKFPTWLSPGTLIIIFIQSRGLNFPVLLTFEASLAFIVGCHSVHCQIFSSMSLCILKLSFMSIKNVWRKQQTYHCKQNHIDLGGWKQPKLFWKKKKNRKAFFTRFQIIMLNFRG